MEKDYDMVVCLECWAHGSTPARLAAMTGGPEEYCDWHTDVQFMTEDEYCAWVQQCVRKHYDDDGGW